MAWEWSIAFPGEWRGDILSPLITFLEEIFLWEE